ncbi:MAG: 30S ribosomal protein S17 [Candidatus Omnitrophota bacterium]
MSVRSKGKEMVGIVISDKMQKSIVVRIDRTAMHPLYRKTIKRKGKVTVHDEKNTAKSGDKVRIREARPFSKTKRWNLVEVLK